VGSQSTIMMPTKPKLSSARLRMDACGHGAEKLTGVEVVVAKRGSLSK
jgi:hypothetical protein